LDDGAAGVVPMALTTDAEARLDCDTVRLRVPMLPHSLPPPLPPPVFRPPLPGAAVPPATRSCETAAAATAVRAKAAVRSRSMRASRGGGGVAGMALVRPRASRKPIAIRPRAHSSNQTRGGPEGAAAGQGPLGVWGDRVPSAGGAVGPPSGTAAAAVMLAARGHAASPVLSSSSPAPPGESGAAADRVSCFRGRGRGDGGVLRGSSGGAPKTISSRAGPSVNGVTVETAVKGGVGPVGGGRLEGAKGTVAGRQRGRRPCASATLPPSAVAAAAAAECGEQDSAEAASASPEGGWRGVFVRRRSSGPQRSPSLTMLPPSDASAACCCCSCGCGGGCSVLPRRAL